jgi:putative colanic acid biosynthesis UDP-glucose lipid carrier transferase
MTTEPVTNPVRRLETSGFKRAIDILGSLAGLVVLSPILVAVGVAIKVETPGPALFRQKRTGHGGAPFVILKFRTMRVMESEVVAPHGQDPESRVTRLGLLLRYTSFDEIPQLLNVLHGEMSLVGPRPHALEHDRYYGARIPAYGLRFRAKPGLTGLAQVSGLRGPTPDIALMAARIERDLEYIDRWSPMSDIDILMRTISMLMFRPVNRRN